MFTLSPWEEQGGLLNDIGDTAGAGALILAGGIADRLGFDEVADNAFGAATDLLEKPGSSGAKEEAVAVLGTTLGAAKTVGDTLIGGAQLAGMAAQETAYDLLGGEQGLGRHIDSLQSNHENIEQIKTSAGEAVKAFAHDVPGSLSKGIEAADAVVDNVLSNVDSVANTESNVERLFASSKVGETAADTALTLTGAAGLVRGGIKTATKNVGAVTDGGTAGRMQLGSVVPNSAQLSPGEAFRQKYSHLTPSERKARLNSLLEEKAYNRLQAFEDSIPRAHFVEKHGAQTTLASQLDRVHFAKNPTTGVVETWPNGKLKKPSSATRFLTHRDQWNAIQRSQTILRNTGDVTLAERPIKFQNIIGEGYKKNGLQYGQSYSGQVWYKNGQVTTAFPIWGQ